jgi:hypothetical protein
VAAQSDVVPAIDREVTVPPFSVFQSHDKDIEKESKVLSARDRYLQRKQQQQKQQPDVP